MKSLAAIALCILSYCSFSQKLPEKFGEVSMQDLEMTTYAKDSSASAVILLDKGEFSLDTQLGAIFKRRTRIKFFTNEAFNDWANETIYLDHSSESISKLNATTYNLENGQIVASKMEETSVFKSKFDKYVDQVKFTLPNVRAGSVIEYSYVKRMDASLVSPWEFQHTIPTQYSEFETFIPSTFTFRKDLQGYLRMTSHEINEDATHERWIMEHAPAFKEEPYTTTPDDYISRVDYHLSEAFLPGQPLMKFTRSWRGIANDLYDDPDFGLVIRGSNHLKKNVELITAGMTEPMQKMLAIYKYVKENIEWNKTIDKIPDHPFKKVLEDKKGSSSEINLLLVCMLQKAGLDSDAVLLSTRSHGKIRSFVPLFSQFNDVICIVQVGDKRMLIDGTDRDLSIQTLPERCLNGEGLIVRKDYAEWIPLSTARAKTITSSTLKIDGEGVLTGQLKIVRDGNEASTMRKSYNELGEKEYVTKAFTGKSLNIDKSNFENIANPNETVKEIHDINVADLAQVSGTAIYFNPYILGKIDENPFQITKRDYPVDFSSAFEDFYLATIEIPEEYRVEELPKPKVLALPNNGGKFSYSATMIANKVNFVSQFMINKSIFTVEEYPLLKEFYDQVIAKQAEQIVLIKK